MSDFDPGILIAGAAIVLALFSALGSAFLGRRLTDERSRSADLQQQLELVRQSITGLTAGAVGLDRRVQRLDRREKLLAERQESFEIHQTEEQPYGHAIRLVQQGAEATRLVDELGLSENEADLIVRLHGHRHTA